MGLLRGREGQGREHREMTKRAQEGSYQPPIPGSATAT